jgi:hypothetical protein
MKGVGSYVRRKGGAGLAYMRTDLRSLLCLNFAFEQLQARSTDMHVQLLLPSGLNWTVRVL